MKVAQVSIRNFRRLEDVTFSLEDDNTVFVGPNNSGKTSVGAAFRRFLDGSGFTINDFTVACLTDLNDFGANTEKTENFLPAIELDLWMAIDPKTEYGRVSALIPNVSTVLDRVGIRLRFCARDPAGLKAAFAAQPATANAAGTLARFLAPANILARHFSVSFLALANQAGTITESVIEADEGKRTVQSLVRVDFIDAQRDIHDQEGGRHNRLSSAFAAYYKHNLEKPSESLAASQVIDENNIRLTAHYASHFKPLLRTIATLGVPNAHDRTLRLISSMNAQEALQGSTELFYVDAVLQHELPEAYNGLGFKNLIYIAIQICHFHAQWLATHQSRELCQLIFVEEPEVHLHAQVQQIFIANMWKILSETAKDAGEPEAAPQLIITTHSSHIVETVDFDKVRYFRRYALAAAATTNPSLAASKVLNLRDFRPVSTEGLESDAVNAASAAIFATQIEAFRAETLRFLKKYLKLTHCDLFFADAAVLVEGTVEKLLLSRMIDQCAPGLRKRYLTVLEVGGAYAHKFSDLLGFLGIPYLVITDIDTVDPGNARKACPADMAGAQTSNAALRAFLGETTRDSLVKLDRSLQVVNAGMCFVTFQRPVKVPVGGETFDFHGRTLEETLIYENLSLFDGRTPSLGLNVSSLSSDGELRTAIYEHVVDSGFKKTEFALSVGASLEPWTTPLYIRDGLQWLEKRLDPLGPEGPTPAGAVLS